MADINRRAAQSQMLHIPSILRSSPVSFLISPQYKKHACYSNYMLPLERCCQPKSKLTVSLWHVFWDHAYFFAKIFPPRIVFPNIGPNMMTFMYVQSKSYLLIHCLSHWMFCYINFSFAYTLLQLIEPSLPTLVTTLQRQGKGQAYISASTGHHSCFVNNQEQRRCWLQSVPAFDCLSHEFLLYFCKLQFQ